MRPSARSSLRQHRILRFLVAGGVNAIFGFAVYSASILSGLPVWSALVVANIAGIAFNFLTMGGYVFRSLVLARLPSFVVAYLCIYLVNLAAMTVLATWIPGKILAQAILTVPMALLSYVLMRRFVFNAPLVEEPPEPT